MQQLDHPNYISRSKTFKKNGILKLNYWKHNYNKWLDKGFVCGDTIEKVGLLREFSLSQFTYQTIEQYLAIEKEVQRNKRRYNQSYEGYFLNPDGTLDYQKMIETIDSIITNGAFSVNQELDKDYNRARDYQMSHAESQIYQAVKLQANGGIPVDYINDDGFDFDLETVQFDGELPDFDL